MPLVRGGLPRSRFLSGLALTAMLCTALSGAACTSSPEAPSTNKPNPGGVQPDQGQTPSPAAPGLLTVSQVEVIILESFPPQIMVKIDGWLPDGCSEVGDIAQQRNDKATDVTIAIRRLSTGACIAIAPEVSRTVRLNGSFADSGVYTVRVNGVEKNFTL